MNQCIKVSLVLLAVCMVDVRAAAQANRAEILAEAKRGLELLKADKGADALEPLQKALAAGQRLFGPEHPDTGTLMQYVGAAYLHLKKYDKAEPFLTDAVRIALAKRAKDDPELATTLETRGRLHREQSRLAKAESDYRQALEAREAKLGNEHADLTESLGSLAKVYSELGDYEQAQAHAARWLRIEEKVHGQRNVKVVPALITLGRIYRDLGKLADAETHFQRSLEILEDQPSRDPSRIADTRIQFAVVYRLSGRSDRAEQILKSCLEEMESRLGKEHPDLAEVLREQAFIAFEGGRYKVAEATYKRAIAVLEKPNSDPVELAHTLNLLSVLYYQLGRYSDAETTIKRAIQAKEKAFGPDHPSLADLFQQLGSVYKRIGRHQEAQGYYLQSLNLTEQKLGDDHPDVAVCLYNLAILYSQNRLHDRAEPLFEEALRIQKKRFGEEHPTVAHTLVGWAGLLMQTGRYEDCEKHLKRALAIRERNPHDTYNLAHTLGELAELYIRQGRFKEAEERLRRCLRDQVDRLGDDHPSVVTTLERLADVSIGRKEWRAAGDFLDRSRRSHRRHLGRVLTGLAEPEQLSFLGTTDAWRTYVALSFGLLHRDDSDIAAQSAAWLLNSKAVAQQAMAERALLARDSTDPTLKELVDQMQVTRARLAALTVSGPGKTNGEEIRRQRDTLVRKEQDLTKQIGQAGGSAHLDLWIELDAVRSALPSDSVLVEFARLQIRRFNANDRERQWDPERYAAWVIPPAGKGRITVVDLGPSTEIAAAVNALRQSLTRPPRSARGPAIVRRGLEYVGREDRLSAEVNTQKNLNSLAKLVLEPLRPHLNKVERWLLSPDADLWLVPWAALPWKDGEFTVESHTISYLVSGRDLLRPPFVLKPGRPVVLADPDYDCGDAPLRRPEKHSPMGPDGWLDLPLVRRLEGTAVEADAVRAALDQYAKSRPQVFLREHATETAIKSARSPRIVLLSTHGFFRPQPKPIAGALGVEPVSPFLQCGLVLAGANRERDPRADIADDGILTGLEILGIELRGTELVVLSACETGLGDVQAGEGVAGLRQAFQLAGARDVLATLWQVPDGDTAIIMARFFETLADGKMGSAEALRAAQREQIRERRAKGQTTHPFFWAAFTLTGPGPSTKK